MKKIILPAILIFVSLSFNGFSQDTPLPVVLGVGSEIHYDLSLGYPFNMTITTIKPDFGFTWNMGSGTGGQVTITKDARKKATRLINYFESGTQVTMDDETTVILSSATYKLIKKGKPANIISNDTTQQLTFVRNETMVIPVNGVNTTFNVLYAETDIHHKYWIWDNAKMPVVFKMDLGWVITMKEIILK
jgi:hypothetical protein